MYQLTSTTNIKRLGDDATIPADPANADYRAYLEWQLDGNTPLPYEAPAQALSPVISRLDFLQRMTLQERIAARASTNPVVADLMHLLNIAATVNLTHETTVQGVNYLESQGILGTGRAAAILAVV
jgi:hypothetical protein